MKIKPHKNKTVAKLPKIDFKGIDYKRLVPKIIVAILLIAVVGLGVYGTVYGIKEKIREKEYKENTTTTVKPVIYMEGKDKTFTENGIKITLTEDFEIFEDPAIDAGFVADGIEVYIIKDSFEDFPEYKDYSEIEYAKHLIEMNGDISVETKEIDDDVYLEYLFDSEKGIIQAYVVKVSKESDCFLLSNFITSSADAIAYKEHILKWAKTVECVGE
jgi:hypothetical protein